MAHDLTRFWAGYADGARQKLLADGASEAEAEWIIGDMLKRLADVPPFDRKLFKRGGVEATRELYMVMLDKLLGAERDLYAMGRH